MANEAYRAVFLRVHPTGKMVLSLTTESDGKESQYAQLVARELGVPALDVKVVPADTDRFGVGHGYNTSPSDGAPAAIVSATEKIRGEGAAARGHGAGRSARDAQLGQRCVGGGERGRSHAGQDARGRRALRARHRRAAARGRGRTRRADGLLAGDQLDGRLASSAISTSSATFSAPNRAEYGLIPQSLCVMTALPLSLPPSPTMTSNAIGRVGADERQVALDADPAAVAGGSAAVERNAMPCRSSTSSSIVCRMFALSSSSSACMPPVPSSTRSDVASASSESAIASSPTSSVACHAVTWISRSCPAFAAAPLRPVRTESVPFVRPELVRAWRDACAESIRRRPRSLRMRTSAWP